MRLFVAGLATVLRCDFALCLLPCAGGLPGLGLRCRSGGTAFLFRSLLGSRIDTSLLLGSALKLFLAPHRSEPAGATVVNCRGRSWRGEVVGQRGLAEAGERNNDRCDFHPVSLLLPDETKPFG